MFDLERKLYADLYWYARQLVVDVPDEHWAEQPAPGLNHPAWILSLLTIAADYALKCVVAKATPPLRGSRDRAVFAPGAFVRSPGREPRAGEHGSPATVSKPSGAIEAPDSRLPHGGPALCPPPNPNPRGDRTPPMGTRTSLPPAL